MLIKRIFDIVFALGGLIILSPVFLLITILIKITSPGSVFFRQIRVGQYEQPFYIHKFRTMILDAEAKGLKITIGRDPRITNIGTILRKSKLDELPQLIDVLIGKMSLVGPRPEVPEYIQYYSITARAEIFKLKPGITDFASIKMIDESLILGNVQNPQKTYIESILPEKIHYAIEYANSHTLWLDIYLIFLTIIKIFIRK